MAVTPGTAPIFDASAVALPDAVAATFTTGRAEAKKSRSSLLSPLFSPIAWSHYQVLLAPMLLLLAIQLPRTRQALAKWVLLGLGYLLAELTWTPLGTVLDFAGGPQLLGSRFLFAEGIVLFARQKDANLVRVLPTFLWVGCGVS